MGCHHSVSCFKVVISWIAPFSQVSKSEMLKNLTSPTIFFQDPSGKPRKSWLYFLFPTKNWRKKPLKKLAWKMPYQLFSSNPMALRSGLTVWSVRCCGLKGNWEGGRWNFPTFWRFSRHFLGRAGENDDLIIGRVEAVDLQSMPCRFQAQ